MLGNEVGRKRSTTREGPMRFLKRTAILALVLVFAVTAGWSEESTYEPPQSLEEGWYARIETGMGRVVVQLLPAQAPQSVAHFVRMARGEAEWFDVLTGESRTDPYYDGILVHNAQAGERFEVGDRTGTGRGAPQIYVPPTEGHGPETFDAGYRLGMTRESGQRISAVQFFITAAPTPWLTGKHPCFGRVVSGETTVFNISQVRTYSNGKPRSPVVIEQIRIFTVGTPPPLEKPVPYTPRTIPFGRRED